MEFFCFSLFILILFLPVHEKHKHFHVWESFVSAHGEATVLNKESRVFPFVYIYIFCLPVHEKRKYCLVWGHVKSSHRSATDLNRESLGVFFFSLFILFYFFLFIKSINFILFAITLCHIMEQLLPETGNPLALFFVSLCS